MEVNEKKCHEIGLAFKSIKFPNLKKEVNNLEKERFLWFIHVAICHQINSDYLENVLRRENLENLENISGDKIRKWLSDYDKPERIRAEERAELIRNAVQTLNEKFEGKVSNLLEQSNFDVESIYSNLKLFKAFAEDPLEKKSSVFIHLLFLMNLTKFNNINKMKPVVDYHIQRVALRNGRIKVDHNFKKKIVQRNIITLEEDTMIRKSTIKALKITTNSAEMNIAQLNYLEWIHGRSICAREHPKCEQCPLKDVCDKKIELLDPVFKSSFY